ncbi:MAG: helix-turn-helix domain-containing protein [Acidobacteria bacterium]|nr:helix-turn-helix domain-containing protein [Acidobacteriota bacterium]
MRLHGAGKLSESPANLRRCAVEKLLTVSEVADLLKVKPSTIYTWARQDRIPHIRIGRLVRFVLSQIEEFISRRWTRRE